jgi:hypothetical protein
MEGDRVEIVVAGDDGSREYEIAATRAAAGSRSRRDAASSRWPR